MHKPTSLATLLLLTWLPGLVAAEALIRSTAQLEQLPVQGVTLGMTANEAFTTLRNAGFQAGNLQSYSDWDSNGIEFVRGTYGSPEGYSSVFFSRRGERLTTLRETFNAPGQRIDADAAISAIRQQLGIPADAGRCASKSTTAGYCELYDAEPGPEVTLMYKLQIMPGMRIITISRPREMGDQ
ncbi:MAG: hypothetical protein AAF993_07175 [Pseudomonadota bacterium]